MIKKVGLLVISLLLSSCSVGEYNRHLKGKEPTYYSYENKLDSLAQYHSFDNTLDLPFFESKWTPLTTKEQYENFFKTFSTQSENPFLYSEDFF